MTVLGPDGRPINRPPEDLSPPPPDPTLVGTEYREDLRWCPDHERWELNKFWRHVPYIPPSVDKKGWRWPWSRP